MLLKSVNKQHTKHVSHCSQSLQTYWEARSFELFTFALHLIFGKIKTINVYLFLQVPNEYGYSATGVSARYERR